MGNMPVLAAHPTGTEQDGPMGRATVKEKHAFIAWDLHDFTDIPQVPGAMLSFAWSRFAKEAGAVNSWETWEEPCRSAWSSWRHSLLLLLVAFTSEFDTLVLERYFVSSIHFLAFARLLESGANPTVTAVKEKTQGIAFCIFKAREMVGIATTY
jgi:hypothetical protein